MEHKLSEGELYESRFQYKEQKSNFYFLLTIVIVAFALLSFRLYWRTTFNGVIVDGGSMVQTLQDGERLLMKKVDDIKDVKRGDIIVVDVSDYPEFFGEGQFLIKRMIAFGGETVRCRNGQISIKSKNSDNFTMLDEPYAYYIHQEGYADFEYVLDEDEVFFLGDNRNESCDSRFGIVGGSRLNDLYKTKDVFGIVPAWAVKHQKVLEKIFF
jgi:signal peptidase I